MCRAFRRVMFCILVFLTIFVSLRCTYDLNPPLHYVSIFERGPVSSNRSESSSAAAGSTIIADTTTLATSGPVSSREYRTVDVNYLSTLLAPKLAGIL